MNFFFYQQNLDNFYKQAFPIVNFYNSRDHYAPTCLISSQLHNQWKINILKGICSQALEVIEEVDSSLVTVPQKNSLLAVQTDVSHLLRVFPDTSPAKQAATFASQESARQPKGPLIHEPIPSSSRVAHSSPGSSGEKNRKKSTCLKSVAQRKQNNKTFQTTKEMSMVKAKRTSHIVTFAIRTLVPNLLSSLH